MKIIGLRLLLMCVVSCSFQMSLKAEEASVLTEQDWSFDGVLGQFDRPQLQRGFQVYKEVCSSCHSLDYVAFRNLQSLGYSELQTKILASEYVIEECCDDQGDYFERPAIPSDYVPSPYPNEQFARASNNGALPPDLSLMTKARQGGPDYLYSLMVGYPEPSDEIASTLMDGMYYNTVYPGNQIAMPKQLYDDLVEYSDGTVATAEQMSLDVSAFLHWAAEPKLEIRKQTGVRVLFFTFIFTVLAYFLKRRIWADISK
jgi:ubiquinol-cytochrome c reductase cytochrome c1 subunit